MIADTQKKQLVPWELKTVTEMVSIDGFIK